MRKCKVCKKVLAHLIVDPNNFNSIQNWSNIAFSLGLKDFVSKASDYGFSPGTPTASGQISMENFKEGHPYIELIITPEEDGTITFKVKRWGSGGTGYDDLLAQFTCKHKCLKYLKQMNKWKEIFFNK